MPVDAIGEGMSWGEAVMLNRALAGDPSSHVAAALAGFVHPVSREAAVLADVWDLLASVNTAKGKPPRYERTWAPKRRRGTPVVTRPRVFSDAETRELLARFGPAKREEASGGE